LQERCDDVSPTVLNTRLKELRSLGLLELAPTGYGYTTWGRELAEQLARLNEWSERWSSGRT
jgi:DNA-binding HxlR family transcriptional regulator